MRDDSPIMLSVAPKYTKLILCGMKAVELRRRAPRITPGTQAWLYSTLPMGQVVALLTLNEVVEAPVCEIWRRFGSSAAVSQSEFDTYFVGADRGAALVIREVQALKVPVSLKDLRERGSFQPPQFYKRIRPGAPETCLSKSELHPVVRPLVA